MALRIGIIGAGVMGADHAETVARRVSGAELVAICDPDRDRAARVASMAGAHHTLDDPHGLIARPDVDAVLVASPDETHADLVIACLQARKPVLCEKPLAPSPEECLRVVAAEAALGQRLIQVGFMRRFDPAYMAMKDTLADGGMGEPLFFHCVHRNATVPPWFNSGMLITNAAVHEIDIARWLLDTEIVNATVIASKPPEASGLRDPQFLVLRAATGAVIDIEVFMNAHYGYDIRGELVCSVGTVALAPPVEVHVRRAGTQAFGFAQDWRARFRAAYQNQLQAWVNSIAEGAGVGASAWDGYVATAVAQVCLDSLLTSAPVNVILQSRPAIYA
jgi:myo-inositol 2-dehydrogenase/D-chiro-inositol 1-dehydrogenase